MFWTHCWVVKSQYDVTHDVVDDKCYNRFVDGHLGSLDTPKMEKYPCPAHIHFSLEEYPIFLFFK